MGNYIEISEYINANTTRFGIGKLEDISSITVQKQLVQIEQFLKEFTINQIQLREKLKQFSKISISSVSVGANVPRSQINLNTNTLKLYIENRILEINKKDTLSIKKIEKLKRDKRELEVHLDGIRQQIVNYFELKLRYEMLETENNRLIQQIESRQLDVQKLEMENSKLRNSLSEYNKSKIVSFNKIE